MKKAFIYTVLIVAVLLAAGCYNGKNLQIGAETPKQVYLKAHMTFNGLLTDYIADKRAAPPELQKEWTEKIDPYFEQASLALKAWGITVMNDTPSYNQQLSYMDIKNQLLDLLLANLVEYE